MNAEEKIRYQSRIWLFYGMIFLIVVVLLVGLANQQILKNDKYNERGKIQNHRRILTPGPRGNIYDREGRLIVSNKSKFSAVVFLSDASVRKSFRQEYYGMVREYRDRDEKFNSDKLQIEARGRVIQSYLNDLNSILGRETAVDANQISRHFNINPLLPYPIIDDLSREELAILLESLPIESPVQIYASHTRHYPYESAASHTLGYVRSSILEPEKELKGGDLRTFSSKGTFGVTGMEKKYDYLLQGKTGMEIWVVDPAGFQVERIQKQAPETGKNLHLALDMDLQKIVEQQFDAYGDRGAFVAIDIERMEILAIVSKPDYNLNDTSPYISQKTAKKIADEGAWLNKAYQGFFPPGSPFKLLTSVAGFKAGLIDENRIIECTGRVKVGRRSFKCHNPYGHGLLNIQEAIRSSCNVYFYTIALEMGIDALSAEAIFLGMDQPTRVDIPYENNRMLVPTKTWKKERIGTAWTMGDTANTAIGQGFLLFSPLQMAMMTASIGTNKVLTHPSVKQRTLQERARMPEAKPLGLPTKYHKMILEGMKLAVDEGTAKMVQEHGNELPIGGKTGTAEINNNKEELAWFVGLAPIDDPKVVVAVVVESLGEGEANHGGVVAAPMAKPFFIEYFRKHPELLPLAIE